YLATGSALEWTLLGRSLTISTLDRRNALDVKEMSPTVEVRAGSVTFYLTVSALPSRQKQRTVRIAGQGEVTYREWLDPVANALEDSPHHFCEWICEIDCPELVLGNELVRKISAARRKDVGNIASKLMQDGTILSTARVLSQNHLEHRAKQLETRIRASKRAEQAVYNSEILMDVPIAETGTVALFHILEGRRGLPFESFRTRSWTPKVGIDAIADFRLAPGELPLSHVPVEFEYGFDTYITHKHEPEHTDLIVCWTVGDGTRRNPRLTRHRLGRSWLWNYRSEAGIDIPVAEMRKFPGLTVKRIGPDDD
ncbi:MAG: hypothetical protein QF637_00705, partial [Acidimicrobiales bacterium]|nr:hypothetical protein [Acidimicrobiales bacterium]